MVVCPQFLESAGAKSGKAHVIKSLHKVGGLPDDMAFELVEPLRELLKDEVRKIGLELGLPYDRVYRHPFPGPGLGVRILGEVKKNTLPYSVKRMGYLSKNSTAKTGITKPPRLSLCFFQ